MLLRIYAIHCFPVVDLGNFEILTICHIPYIFRTSAIWIAAVPHLSLPPWLWCVNTVCYLVHKYFCLSRIDRFSSAVVAAQQWSRQTLWSNITYVNLSPKKVEKKDNMTERLRNCMRAVATRRKKKENSPLNVSLSSFPLCLRFTFPPSLLVPRSPLTLSPSNHIRPT